MSQPCHVRPAARAEQRLARRSASVVETACPLDCPDACSLAVTVQHGRVVEIDGSTQNPVTGGYICAKVRRFDERVYGPDRLLLSRASARGARATASSRA